MAVDYFLKIDQINGESQQVNHKLEMEMESWSFGETMKATPAAGTQGGVQKVTLNPFRFTKRLDASSPKVVQACANGGHIAWARFSARRSGETGGQPVDYLFITFGDLVITHYDIMGMGEDGWPSETIAFSYSNIVMTYKQMINGVAQGAINGGYQTLRNTSLAAVPGAPAPPST